MARQAAGASPAAPTTAAHYWRRRLAAVQTAIGTMPEAARGSAGFRELVLPPPSAFPLYDREMVRRADEAGHKAIPLTRASDPPGTDQVGLTAAECDFFRQHGFLVKRGLLPQSSLAECVDRAWSVLSEQQPSVVRSDRATHVDPQRHWSATKGPSTTPHGHPTTRNWPMTFTGAGDWNWHGLGSDPEWLAATSAHPNVLHMVEALIGGPVKVPTRNRGIYCIFPHADPGNLGPHHDWHPFDLGGMAYISAVAPFSGGTTFWPGSHVRLQRTLPNEQACGFVANEAYNCERAAIIEQVQPVEITGDAGDFLFFHPCLVHSRGLNSLHHGSGDLRIASPQDFQRQRQKSCLMWQLADGRLPGHDGSFPPSADSEKRDKDVAEGDMSAQLIWHHDTLELASWRPLLQDDDMWSSWNLGKVPVSGSIVHDPSWWERYGVPMCTPNMQLREIAEQGQDGVWQLL